MNYTVIAMHNISWVYINIQSVSTIFSHYISISEIEVCLATILSKTDYIHLYIYFLSFLSIFNVQCFGKLSLNFSVFIVRSFFIYLWQNRNVPVVEHSVSLFLKHEMQLYTMHRVSTKLFILESLVALEKYVTTTL